MYMFQVSKSCSRQPLTLSVTRGVRSRPQDDVNPGVVVETVPLLSPTMESELLKQPWTFPRTKINLTKDEDNTNSAQTFSSWEEDFQDLSSWCMDTFQGQCDFHIGESATFKISGTYVSYVYIFIIHCDYCEITKSQERSYRADLDA